MPDPVHLDPARFDLTRVDPALVDPALVDPACTDAVCRETRRAARAELRRHGLDPADGLLVVEPDVRDVRNVRWRFSCHPVSSSDRAGDDRSLSTWLDCRLHPDSRQMWIGDLRVAPLRRRRGWGRRLVRAAEGVARAMSSHVVTVFPLVHAVPFWQRLGYRPHDRTARVYVKIVTAAEE